MDQDKKILDKLWELTRQLSAKGARRAEKMWKVNSLRVEIASFKHRINVKYKELGRFVYESTKSGIADEDNYKTSVEAIFAELTDLEGEISERENRIEELEEMYRELDLADEEQEEEEEEEEKKETPPPIPEEKAVEKEDKPKPPRKPAAKKPAAKKPAAKKTTTGRKKPSQKSSEEPKDE